MEKSMHFWSGQSKQRQFAFLIAILVTGIIFSPYLGQKLFSDTVTFQKTNDSLQQTFPAFVQAWKVMQRGCVDLTSFNGASEMATAAPMEYPPFVLFSFLGRFTSFRFAFILFYAVHMLLSVYCGILLGMEHFGFDKRFACLFALSSLSVVFESSWFVAFYIAVTWFLPTMYLSICALKESRWTYVYLCSIGYVMSFLGGSVLLAVFSCALVAATTIAYGFFWLNMPSKRSVLLKSAVPLSIAGMAVVLYYLRIFLSIKRASGGGSSSLADAAALPLVPKDLFVLFTEALAPQNSIEQPGTIYIGFAWALLLCAFAFCGHFSRNLTRHKKWFLWICYIIFAVLLFTSMGTSTPVQYWFYALVPYLGRMHLPIRYILFAKPLFFLASALLLMYCEKSERIEKVYTIGAAAGCAGILFLLFDRDLIIAGDQNVLLVELILFTGWMLFAKKNMKSGISIVLLVLCTIISPLQSTFYCEMLTTKRNYEERSIVYSENKISQLDSVIDTLPKKERYRFISLDSDRVPVFVPSSYAAYEYSAYPLTNYLGYPLHISMAKEYFSHFSWYHFTTCDWEYIADTRGDFAVFDLGTVESAPELFERYFDLSYDGPLLDSTHKIYKMKKFIPLHYTQGERVEDTGNTLDNGYFYSPYLSSEALAGFQTDNGSWFQADIVSDRDTDIAFLMYPHRYFHYYVDGTEIMPLIEAERVYIPITAGTHQIRVQYIDYLNMCANVALLIYFSSFVFVAVYSVYRRVKMK